MSRIISEIVHDLTNIFGNGPIVVKSLDRNLDNDDADKVNRDLIQLEKMSTRGLELVKELRALFKDEDK